MEILHLILRLNYKTTSNKFITFLWNKILKLNWILSKWFPLLFYFNQNKITHNLVLNNLKNIKNTINKFNKIKMSYIIKSRLKSHNIIMTTWMFLKFLQKFILKEKTKVKEKYSSKIFKDTLKVLVKSNINHQFKLTSNNVKTKKIWTKNKKSLKNLILLHNETKKLNNINKSQKDKISNFIKNKEKTFLKINLQKEKTTFNKFDTLIKWT